jgi:hypothetical protein
LKEVDVLRSAVSVMEVLLIFPAPRGSELAP